MVGYMDTCISPRQKRLRATCETWPHKRKIFHLKSKRRPKSCKIHPTKCCSHQHWPQESLGAAAKGLQDTQHQAQAPRNPSGVCSPAQGSCATTATSPKAVTASPGAVLDPSTPHWAPQGPSSTSGSPGHQGGLARGSYSTSCSSKRV